MMKHLQRFSGFISLMVVFLLTLNCSGNDNEKNIGTSDPEAVAGDFVAGDTLQITGSLICAHCYALNQENTGHDHVLPESGFRKDCAGYCSLQGYPIGVLLDKELAGSKVWIIRTSSQLFADYMTRTVRIEGTYVSEGVIEPLNIELKSRETGWLTIM